MALIGKTNKEKIWNYYMQKDMIGNPYGVAGLMGNIEIESGYNPKNMQNSFENKLNFTDETYVIAVDNNTYHEFQTDRCGFGLTQTTIPDRKTNMWVLSKEQGRSIGDLEFQCDFIMWELTTGYKQVLKVLKNATSVKEASDYVYYKYERPKVQNEDRAKLRSDAGLAVYAEFVKDKQTTKQLTLDEFIEQTATYLKKYAPKYNINCYSAIIAQGILESGRATSELAVNANNFFGLKFKKGRCPSALSEPYYKVGSEQDPITGEYTSSAMQWFQFKDLEQCVIGYLDFINTSRYSALKGVTDPKKYLELIKSAGYATSLAYVDNVFAVVEKYNLTKYDEIKKVEEKPTTEANKVNDKLKIRQCILVNNDCYKKGNKITPIGIVVHSTGANNTRVSRYVQPDDGVIGTNKYNNHWNRSGVKKCVHAFIGTDKNGNICTVQTLPWDYKCWGVGSGKKGSYNNSHIQFEICEDALKNETYFNKVFDEAAELCAYFMKLYPNITIDNIVSHHESYLKGYGGNHSDCDHWLKKFGKNMNWFREQVAKKTGTVVVTPSTPSLPSNNIYKVASDKKAIQTYLNIYYGDAIKAELGEELVVDGSIGAKSRKALTIAVQTELNKLGAGLEVDGSFGSRTTSAYTKYVGTLKKGNKDNIFITLWQCTLVGLNYNPNGIDGSFGNGCKSATTEFQKKNKLTATGALNANTFKKALK